MLTTARLLLTYFLWLAMTETSFVVSLLLPVVEASLPGGEQQQQHHHTLMKDDFARPWRHCGTVHDEGEENNAPLIIHYPNGDIEQRDRGPLEICMSAMDDLREAANNNHNEQQCSDD